MTETVPRQFFLPLRRYLLMAFIALIIAAGFTVSLRAPSAAADTAIIVDNTSATTAGSWTTSTYQADYYGSNYLYHASGGTGTNTVTWTPNLPAAGNYAVYYWLPDGAGDRASDAPFTVTYNGGSQTVLVDESATTGGQWKLLGTFAFNSGTSGSVQVSDQASSSYVVADAIEFMPTAVDNTSATTVGTWTASTFQANYYGSNYLYRASGGTGANTVTWTPTIAVAGNYAVYYWLPTGTGDRATNAPFTVNYNGGSQTILVNESTAAGGQWTLLGTFAFNSGTSGSVQLSDKANGTYVVADAVEFVPASSAQSGSYTVRLDLPKQTLKGLGIEIQFDSIGSGNNGLPGYNGVPDSEDSIPHDLTTSERTRLYTDMLQGGPQTPGLGGHQGFRYIRLAMGLYLRGLDASQQHIQERWSGQIALIQQLVSQSGAEGVDLEYWSPAPGWKSNSNYIGGSLAAFDDTFLGQVGDAMVQDINYLESNGIPVVMWGLQNEPSVSTSYSTCVYTSAQYYEAFKVIAPKIHTAYPNIYIHANSEGGQNGVGGANIRADSSTLALVDGWSWHKIGDNSNDQISTNFTTNALGKDVFNDEFEYLDGSTSLPRMVNTAQSIMNWMTFQNAPTWFWLHALKRSNDSVAQGYGLGIWRPADDTDFSHYPDIQPGHWDYLPYNWDAVAGFIRYMPENSVRYQVDESTVLQDNRIMAWKTPSGNLVVALTSRNANNFTFNVNLGGARTMAGYEFNGTLNSVSLGTRTGSTLAATLAPDTIQFWVEQ